MIVFTYFLNFAESYILIRFKIGANKFIFKLSARKVKIKGVSDRLYSGNLPFQYKFNVLRPSIYTVVVLFNDYSPKAK